MKVEILEVAQTELEDAVWFYELEQAGLGRRFKKEVHRTLLRIRQSPQTWPIERGEIRKCFVHTFPYTVFYSLQEHTIVIVAIAHQHRKPGYWTDRVEESP